MKYTLLLHNLLSPIPSIYLYTIIAFGNRQISHWEQGLIIPLHSCKSIRHPLGSATNRAGVSFISALQTAFSVLLFIYKSNTIYIQMENDLYINRKRLLYKSLPNLFESSPLLPKVRFMNIFTLKTSSFQSLIQNDSKLLFVVENFSGLCFYEIFSEGMVIAWALSQTCRKALLF